MRVTIRRSWTVAERRAEIEQRYGGRSALEAHVRDEPDDLVAAKDLHDLDEYADERPNKRVDETFSVFLPDDELDDLSMRRFQLLITLKGMGGEAESVRSLAREARRDVKNVSEDVRILSRLGLVRVQNGSGGRAHRVLLPGGQIDLHLVEA